MTAPAELHAPTFVHPTSTTQHAGFVLYVGLRDSGAGGSRTGPGDLAEVAEALRDLARDLLPTAETFTALSLVPHATAPDDVRTLRERLTHLRPLEGRTGIDEPAPRSPSTTTTPHHPAALRAVQDSTDSRPISPESATRTGLATEPADDAASTRIDLTGRRVFVRGRSVNVTPLEFDLLAHLVRSPHRVVGRAELLRSVWHDAARPGTRTVDVHVRRLRAKVTGEAIATIRGVGYRFDPTPQIVLSGSGDAR